MSSASDIVLYTRHDEYIPRIAAIHDLCGYGKCSLGVAIPVLSAGGCDVCSVPTSLFSAHTGYKVFYMHDTTPMLEAYLDAWQQEDVDLDAVYSGFLGSAEQVATIKRLYAEYPHALHLVDPVMGDGGKMYPTYTPELCDAMRELVDGADLLTPNVTEACILAGIEYPQTAPTDDTIKKICEALLKMGAKNVVVKGIIRGDGYIRDYLAGRDFEMEEICSPLLPFMLHGTGDLYASCCIAAPTSGRSFRAAAEFAGNTVRKAMQVASKLAHYLDRGVSFELVLSELTALVDKR